jgi:Tfp pilus assembly protein PilX
VKAKQQATRKSHRRDGFVVIAVMVALVISVTLFGLWARAAVREHQEISSQALRIQATRLAEAGLQRAIAQRTADAQYAEETWIIPATDLAGTHAAEVRILITLDASGTALVVKAVAEYPTDEVRHAQVTKQIEIAIPSRENPS